MVSDGSKTWLKDYAGWRVEGCLVLFLVLTAWAVRQAVYVPLYTDSIGYLSFARNILSGVHHGDGITLARYIYPPLYPHLVALFSMGNSDLFNLVETGRQVSISAGTLTVLPLYMLARDLFGVPAAAASAFILILTPEALYYSGSVLTESTGALFVVLALWLLWRFTDRDPRGIPWRFLILGAVLGLSFLTRHAAAGFAALAAAWIVACKFSRSERIGVKSVISSAIPLILVVTGFLGVIAPQVLYLRSETGLWTLTGNLLVDPSRSWETAGRDLRFTLEGESRSALTDDGRYYIFEEQQGQNNPASSLMSVVLSHPVPYFKAYITTVAGGLIRDTRSLPYPKIIIILALAGLFFVIVRRQFREMFFLLWIFGGYYLFLALFHNMRDRYMFPVLPVLLILAGAGASGIHGWAAGRLERFRAGVSARTVVAGLITVVLFAALFPLSTALVRDVNTAYDIGYYRAMHDELAKRIEPGSYIFDRMPHRAFFAGAKRAVVPYDSIDRVAAFGRLRGVRYWIVSYDYVQKFRPQFLPLMDDPSSHEQEIRPLKVYGDGTNRKTILFEILREEDRAPVPSNTL